MSVTSGDKVLQERIDALEDMLHEERLLTQRNATQAIQFQKGLEFIARQHPEGCERDKHHWACGMARKTLGRT